MKITITLLALLIISPALASEPRYALETQRAVTPFRGDPMGLSECVALKRAFALDEARLAHLGEPMEARCVPVND